MFSKTFYCSISEATDLFPNPGIFLRILLLPIGKPLLALREYDVVAAADVDYAIHSVNLQIYHLTVLSYILN